MTERKENSYQVVNRAFVVSLANPKDIFRFFLHTNEIDGQQLNPRILRFYLGLKGKEGNHRYTLLGGKIDDLENPSEALVREMVEEAGVFTLGLPHHTEIGRWQYIIPGKNEAREVILTYQPILPQEQIVIGDPKIQSIVAMSLKELKELIEKGKLDGIPIEGHLTLSPQEDINISQEDFNKQKNALNKGITWMSHIENWLQKKFTEIFAKNPHLTYEEFEKEYQKILSRFMRRGIETALPYKRTRESSPQEKHPILSALNEGYLGRDILYFLPQLAEHGLEWSGLEETTDGVRIFIDFIRSVFDSFEEKEQFLLTITDSNTPLNKKHDMLIQFNNHFKTILREIFGLTNEQLNHALELAQSFYRELLVDISASDDGFRGVYQDYALTNEVNNAHYGYLLTLFLGYDTKNNNPEQMKKIRFEAGRQLLILLKTLSIYNLYHQSLSQAKEGIVQTIINNLGSLEKEEFVELEPEKTIRVRKRKLLIPDFENFEIIIDEKPNKPFSSFLRKSFFEPPAELKDITNVNIVLGLDYHSFPKENLLDLLDRFQSKLLDFIKAQFRNNNLESADLKNYGLESFVKENNLDQLGGYRPGSQSSRFLRRKFILKLDEGNHLEIIIYPFTTTNGDNQWWGWLETMKDNDDYRQRRLFASENGIPSFYDLLFPPEIYPAHYQQKAGARYHNNF